ncbi:hypothetical protein J4E93_002926 [Alternaria ventricosa]|uniref:uncharacterized protein n=1 Tax=Alternaria ventricosa TaxID=1187951 RepID=UPI0020C36E8B|nr:uncharacterized protein J4E93_002926 [Alternaria ventricosa]KAI4650570.1 hypothetical protein J4E93_002926 [Alternaria ventricosa]
MADPSTPTAAPDPPPKCTICKSDLTIRDKQKTTKNYWKNCQSCRDKMKTAAFIREETKEETSGSAQAETKVPQVSQDVRSKDIAATEQHRIIRRPGSNV